MQAAAIPTGPTSERLKPEQARSLLKALSDPLRLRILETLANGERCVCDLTGELALSQSRLSFHLKVLREAGLLSDRQSGRWVYYRLKPDQLMALQEWLGSLVTHCKRPATGCHD
jgi:ArsR family transcriptional regulator